MHINLWNCGEFGEKPTVGIKTETKEHVQIYIVKFIIEYLCKEKNHTALPLHHLNIQLLFVRIKCFKEIISSKDHKPRGLASRRIHQAC